MSPRLPVPVGLPVAKGVIALSQGYSGASWCHVLSFATTKPRRDPRSEPLSFGRYRVVLRQVPMDLSVPISAILCMRPPVTLQYGLFSTPLTAWQLSSRRLPGPAGSAHPVQTPLRPTDGVGSALPGPLLCKPVPEFGEAESSGGTVGPKRGRESLLGQRLHRVS